MARKPKPQSPNVYEVADAFRRALLAGERDMVRQLEGAWTVALARIQRRLDHVTRLIESTQAAGGDVSPAWLYRQERFKTLIATIRVELAQVSGKASIVAERQAELAALGVTHGIELMAASGIVGDFLRSDPEAFKEIVALLSDASPVTRLFQEFGPEAVSWARRAFAEGLAEGSNPRKIARKLREQIDLTKRRSETIARTETLRAYRTAHQRVYEENRDVVTGVIVSSSRDSRTCPLCLAQDGKILAHAEQFATHPMCRCALLPFVQGYTPDRGTGEDWLRKQPAAHQRFLLGPSRLELWKNGDFTLPQFITYTTDPVWGKGVKFIPLADLRK